jgi:hypothetical protein
MIITGGAYLERCIAPSVYAFLGSGGRATLALRQLEETIFHTFHPNPDDVRANFGADSLVYGSPSLIEFCYLHPLAIPTISPAVIQQMGAKAVVGERILRFGCLEGSFRLDADWAIFDPQGESDPGLFVANGSIANRLAIILNAEEASEITGEAAPKDAAKTLKRDQNAEVVVIKMGVKGALVFDSSAEIETHIPAFKTDIVYKIGSGDIFSAMFAHHWATKRLPPNQAAYLASQHVAAYVASRLLPCPSTPTTYPSAALRNSPLEVAVMADDDTTQSRWIVAEAQEALLRLGVARIVPFDRLNPGQTSRASLFAIAANADGRALSAVRSAIASGIPCVCFSENEHLRESAALLGATTSGDFAGALYGIFWED